MTSTTSCPHILNAIPKQRNSASARHVDGAVVAETRGGREPSGAPQSEQQLPMRSFVAQPSSGAEADDEKATHTWT